MFTDQIEITKDIDVIVHSKYMEEETSEQIKVSYKKGEQILACEVWTSLTSNEATVDLPSFNDDRDYFRIPLDSFKKIKRL